MNKLEKVTAHLMGIAMEGKMELFLADAALFLEFFGIIAIAWQWLLQATVARKALAGNPPIGRCQLLSREGSHLRLFLQL